MPFLVDEFGKVTVSLGGTCPLGCRHCYTMTSTFTNGPSRTPQAVIDELQAEGAPFQTICVSGDTDPFVDENAGLDLILRLAETFDHADLLFTTRLVPSDGTTVRLIDLGATMARSGRLLVPGISMVSMRFPNVAETRNIIPPPERRLELLTDLTVGGLKCLAALRPTFPFAAVPASEVDDLIDALAGRAAVVLGEVFILDLRGQIASRLGLSVESPGDRFSMLSFLKQPERWRKRSYPAEVAYTKEACRRRGLPFFLRSGTALKYLREHHNLGQSPGNADDHSVLDGLDP